MPPIELSKRQTSLRPDLSGRPGRPHFHVGPNASSSPEQTSLLLEYVRVLVRRRGMLLVFALAGAALGFLTTVPSALRYQARTTFDIQGLNENFMNMRAVDPTSMPAGFPAESYLATQIKLIQSESMLARVARRLKEQPPAQPVEPNDRWSQWKRRLGWPVSPGPSWEELVDRTAASVKVKPLGMTRLVETTCESPSPELAASFCNTLGTEFIAGDLEVRWETAQKTSEYLSRQLQDVRSKLQTSEQLLQAYAKESTLLFSPDKESVAQEKLRQLQTELSRAQADRVAKQAQYELIASATPESLPPVLDSGPLRDYQTRLSDLRREHADLSAQFTADYPKVKRVQAQIDELESTVSKERANVIARIRNEHSAARQRESLLSKAYAGQERIVSGLVPKAAQYNMLLREVESSRQLYETLLQRTKEAGFVSAMRSSPMRVVDLAKVPVIPSAPRRKASGGAGLALGTLAGVLVAILRERTDRKLRMPGDAATHLHVRELGIIPAASVQDLGRRGFSLPRSTPGSTAVLSLSSPPADSQAVTPQESGMPALEISDNKSVKAIEKPVRLRYGRDLDLVTWRHKGSLLAESYRAVMTSLLFAEGSVGQGKVRLAVSSPSASEGKTTLASNLGIALAQTGRRVVLVDGDLRRPRFHRIFDLPNTFGFSDLLSGSVDVKTCPTSLLAQPALVPGLFVLPSGSPVEDAASTLFSGNLEALVERLGTEFDAVIIDTPPMLHLADARVLARLTDGVVLVFRAGVTTRDSAGAAQGVFAADGTPILGIVLNDFNPQRESFQRYYNGYFDYQRQDTA